MNLPTFHLLFFCSSKGGAEQKTLTHTEDDRFMCPVTFKSFGRATKACVLKPSGQVVHASVVKDYIEKFGECPISGAKMTKKDVIMIKEGGTGFAGKHRSNLHHIN